MKELNYYSQVDIGVLNVSFYKGGFWEGDGKRGTSHLMEHLICKKFADLYGELNAKSIDWNAYTSNNNVVFTFSGLNEYLNPLRETLVKKITHSENIWTKEQFENEKKTVLQEYYDTFQDPVGGAYQNLLRKHYNDATAIGLAKDIESFTYEDSLEQELTFATPNSIYNLSDDKSKPHIDPLFSFGRLDNETKLEFIKKSDMELEKIPKGGKVMVGLLHKKPIDVSNNPYINFIMHTIAGGIDTPLYQEVREKRGLSYFVSAFSHISGNNIIPAVIANTDKGNAKQLRDVFREFFSKSIAEHVPENKFLEFKQSAEIQFKMIKALPHSMKFGLVSSFDGIMDLTYDKFVNIANENLKLDLFEEVKV